MTASTIRLRSPAHLLAVIPHLLGLHPDRSVVLLSLRRHRISLTERIDLPPAAEAAAITERVIQPLPRDDPDSAVIVGYETEAGESLPILEQLTDVLTARGIPIVDRIVVRDGRWRSLDCDSPDCCPPDGSPLPTPLEAANVVADFVGEGVVPFACRAGLEAMVEAGPGATEVAALIAGAEHHDPQEALPGQEWEALAVAQVRRIIEARIRLPGLWDKLHDDGSCRTVVSPSTGCLGRPTTSSMRISLHPG